MEKATAKALEDVYAAEGRRILTPWEKRFVDDMYERFVTYGDRCAVTPKQALILRRICEKAKRVP